MSSGNWGPAYGLLKEDHDALVAARGRPVTQDAMREAKPQEPSTDTGSLIDNYIQPKGNP